MWKYRKRTLQLLLALLLVAVIGFVLWAELPYTIMDEAKQQLVSNDDVTVRQQRNWIAFAPADMSQANNIGVILFPGARLDAESFAHYGQELAAEGHSVFILHSPLNLAIFNINGPAEVIDHYPSITEWYLGGHSLGGAVSSIFADANPEALAGIFFLGSYPAKDLSGLPIKAISIFADQDLVSDLEDIEARKPMLPAKTDYLMVEGGNHAGFAWYGPQQGDGEATISRVVQTSQAIAALQGFIAN